MTDFDPKKALAEMIAGLSDVLTSVSRMESRATQKMSEAEIELGIATKLRAYVAGELNALRNKLKALMQEEQGQ